MSDDTTALLDRLTAGTPPGPCVVSIGNFDGVHRGHRSILDAALADARARSLPLHVVTFEPHPDTVFRGLQPSDYRLGTSESRERLLLAAGASHVLTLPFDSGLANLDAEDFLKALLVQRVGARSIHVGYDFSYGKGRGGNTQRLQREAAPLGVDVTIHDALLHEGQPISSTRIRNALRAGDMATVSDLLGRHWAFEGVTRSGAGRGKGLGAPTLNLHPGDYLVPPFGIYACYLWHEQRRYDTVASLGVRPTFDDGDHVTFESYVLEHFPVEARGLAIRVELLEYIRPELKFPDAESLAAAIEDDVVKATAILKRFREA